MRVDIQPRQQRPLSEHNESVRFAADDNNVPSGIYPVSQQIFSATHLPGCQIPMPPQTKNAEALCVVPCQEMSIFDRQVFSKPFEQLYRAALQAIRSQENQDHFIRTGQYLPATDIAINKFMAMVETKSATTTNAAVSTFLEGPLTLIEAEAWQQFVNELPASLAQQAVTPTTSWKPVSASELRAALLTEPAFALFLQKPEGTTFASELMAIINKKTADMLPTDKGMALVFRFDSTYGSVSHAALSSLWRDDAGKLCLGIAHQESVPASQASGGVWTGVVYNTFDTSKDYPGGKAPVIESIKLAGFPSVNVFPCPRPEAIRSAVEKIAGIDKIHPYGGTDNWNEKKRGTLPADRPFETCFNVTHKVLAELYDVTVPQTPTLPTTLWAMRPFTSMSATDLDTVSISTGKATKSIDLAKIAGESPDNIRKAFAVVGEKWGLSRQWDISSPLRGSKHSLILNPGDEGINLPKGTCNIKFITNPPQLLLEGKPVLAGQTYTSEKAEKMVYLGKEQSKPILIVAALRNPAKL